MLGNGAVELLSLPISLWTSNSLPLVLAGILLTGSPSPHSNGFDRKCMSF
jgi:hypothetical protein